MTIVPLLHFEIYCSIYLEVDFLLLNTETRSFTCATIAFSERYYALT